MSGIVSFRRMQDGTREDYLLLDESEREYAVGLGGRVLENLRKLDHSLAGYPVSRLRHCLQAATRAMKDGADEEMIVAALIHDIGDEQRDLVPVSEHQRLQSSRQPLVELVLHHFVPCEARAESV